MPSLAVGMEGRFLFTAVETDLVFKVVIYSFLLFYLFFTIF